MALVDMEKFGEGLPYLEQAVRGDPEQTWVYAWAQCYLGTGQYRDDDVGDDVSAGDGEVVGSGCDWDYAHFKKVRVEREKYLARGVDSLDFPVKPQRLVADVRAALPDDGILTLDNGVYKIWFARNFRAAQPNSLLLDNARIFPPSPSQRCTTAT